MRTNRGFTLMPKILAFVILTEIIFLLVVPITYYLFFVSSQPTYGEFTLTNNQIRESWPNLPTGDEIRNNDILYNNYTSVLSPPIKNCTRINMPSNFGGIVVPVRYIIFVQDSAGSWIEVPQEYLRTDNPPQVNAEGFIGTNLPNEYLAVVTIVIAVSTAVGIAYILRQRAHAKK